MCVRGWSQVVTSPSGDHQDGGVRTRTSLRSRHSHIRRYKRKWFNYFKIQLSDWSNSRLHSCYFYIYVFLTFDILSLDFPDVVGWEWGRGGAGVEDGSGSDEETNKKRNLTSLKVTLTLTCSTPREFIRWRSAAVIKPFCQSDCQWNFSFSFFFFILKLKAAPPSPPWPSPLYSKAAPQRLFTPVHG